MALAHSIGRGWSPERRPTTAQYWLSDETVSASFRRLSRLSAAWTLAGRVISRSGHCIALGIESIQRDP